MSNLKLQNRSDELASVFLHKRLTGEFGEYFDFQPHGEKDNTPDTDGFLRLRKKVSDSPYLIKNLPISYFYQQKGTRTQLKNGHIYNCKRDVIEFCIQTNLPTLLFVVYIENNQGKTIYYKYFDTLTRKHFQELIDTNPTINSMQITHMDRLDMDVNFHNFYDFLIERGRINQLNDLPLELESLTLTLRDALTVITSVLYLARMLPVANFAQKIHQLYGFKINEIQYVMRKLKQMEVLEVSTGFYALKGMEVGRELESIRFASSVLIYAIDKIDIDQLIGTFLLDETQVNNRLSMASITSRNQEERVAETFDEVLSDIANL